MIISEIFGPTIQGEGPSAGQQCGFIRLGRCNLTCSWCDTSYTWDWSGQNGTPYDPAKELSEVSLTQVVDQLQGMDVAMVVITGGEPLLQRSALTALCGKLKGRGFRIEIETNGTLAVWPELRKLVDQFNVGLKLANSGVAEEGRIVDGAVNSFLTRDATDGKSIFKFVVRQVDELAEVACLQERFSIADSDIWIMPEGTRADVLEMGEELLEPQVVKRNWQFTTRLHILQWGDRRGV